MNSNDEKAIVSFSRCERINMDDIPLKDGQLIISRLDDEFALLYVDIKIDGTVVRLTNDINNYAQRIYDLERRIEVLESKNYITFNEVKNN